MQRKFTVIHWSYGNIEVTVHGSFSGFHGIIISDDVNLVTVYLPYVEGHRLFTRNQVRVWHA